MRIGKKISSVRSVMWDGALFVFKSSIQNWNCCVSIDDGRFSEYSQRLKSKVVSNSDHLAVSSVHV